MSPLNSHLITELLENKNCWSIECHDEVTSTSDLARAAGIAGVPSGLAVFAESQSNGRGQRNNRWITPKGLDLMFSVLLRPDLPMVCWPRLTTLAALAVCKAIEAVVPLHPKIKWPNDIYVSGRKVSGLLAETFVSAGSSFLVLGVGLNVNTTSFPPEIRDTATSLLRELPAYVQSLDREMLAAALLNELARAMELWGEGFTEAVAQVRTRSLLLGRQVRATLEGREVTGKVLDLNHEGHLVLQLLDGSSQTLSSAAEVRLVH